MTKRAQTSHDEAGWKAALRGDRTTFQATVAPHLEELLEAAPRELRTDGVDVRCEEREPDGGEVLELCDVREVAFQFGVRLRRHDLQIRLRSERYERVLCAAAGMLSAHSSSHAGQPLELRDALLERTDPDDDVIELGVRSEGGP